MKNFRKHELFQIVSIVFLLFLGKQNSSLAAVIWSDITATPNEGTISIVGTGNVGTIPNIQKISPSDKIGNSIAVNTLLSAVNSESGSFAENLAAISKAGLDAAQRILTGADPKKTLLDTTVGLIGTLVKDPSTAGISAVSYNAVVDSSNDPIFSIALTFSAIAVVEKENNTFSKGFSKAEIQASATFNGKNIPITFKTLSPPVKMGENRLEVSGENTIENELTAFTIRGEGSSIVDPTSRGILSISPVVLLAQQAGGDAGSADTFSSFNLTNWTATVKTVSTPEYTSTFSLLALGTLGAASTLKRKLKPSKSSEKETTTVS
ncbi:MAG: hypothetical protein NT917_17625 [Microcystis aeruginosa WS75]|nr:hypothetical protein [Microcystis aeruginosa WS75]